MGKIMRLGLISIMLICVITSMVSAVVSMTGPDTVTRGGVSVGEPNVDGYFNLSVNANDTLSAPMHLGLIINPQMMTGDICDRPPYLDNSTNPSTVFLGTAGGDVPVWPIDVSNPFTFSQVVPNGVDAPSAGCWVVPWESVGTHYYGMINTNNTTIRVGTLYPDVAGSNEFLSTSLKPGDYSYHLQTDNLARSVPGVDSSDYNVTVTFGQLTAGAYNFTSWSQGSLVPVTSIQAGHTVMLQGVNTDSQTTHLWLAGEGLPTCGIELTDYNLTVQSNPPSEGGAYLNGTWFYQFTAPCTGGEYTVYASSIDPSDVVSRMCNNNDGGSCVTGPCGQGGICGLINCPTCAPAPGTVTFTVTVPDFTFTLPEIVERCCCEIYPCGSADSMTNVNLTGHTGTPGQPIQIWLFGNDWIGSKPYLIDTKISLLDAQGSFSLDLRNMLSDENINFCDIAAGDYNLIIQIPGCNSRTFDVGPEYIPSDLIGYNAYKALINKLNDTNQSLCLTCPPVKDQYILLKFTIRDVCNGGSVDFTGTPTSGFVSLPVQFTDKSTFVGTNWTWNFGDNFTSAEQNPLHVYTVPGAYTVTLQVTNGTTTKQQKKYDYIIVNEVPAKYYEPVANFTYTINHDTTGEVQFIDQSSGSTPLTYFWQFGDLIGSNSTNVSPIHQYDSLGVYPVTLTVTDTFGKTNSSTVSVDVTAVPLYIPPQANFTYVSKSGEPMTIQFIDQSTGSTKLDYIWDFGDGANSTEKVPAHTYETPATYNVSLSVTDTYANVSTVIEQIQVPAKPSVVPSIDFTADILEGQYPLTVQFLDTTIITWADSWQWNFGDGAVSSLRSPIHIYTTPGLYTVTLRAANVNGEGSEMIKPDYINVQNEPPFIIATADPMAGTFPLRVEFTASATVNNKTPEMSAPLIRSWLWDFGDSSVSAEQNPIHVYEAPGNYQVTVTCQLYDGMSSIADVGIIEVGPQPYANFYWEYLDKDETCCYLVKFTDTSVGATDVEWDFGDGLTSVERNPTHRFKEVGYYNVTLTVTESGKVDSMTQIVQITNGYTTPTPTPTPVPVPGAVEALFYTTAIGTRTIQFTDQSTGLIQGSSTWAWDFGDGTTSGEQNPLHLYPTDGEFEVRLKVSNGQFSGTAYQTIGVR